MLTIRLFRIGRKNQPAFKVVVTDKRNPAHAGRFVEEVGRYNPLTKDRKFLGDRIKYWISVGAKPSDTVWNMILKEGIVEGKRIPKHATVVKKQEEAVAAPQV